MGWLKKLKKKLKKAVKINTPKITIGKDLGMKNIGKAASSAVSSVGKTTGDALKIAESGLKAQGKLLTGDFKGAGKETLQGFTSAGNIAGEIGGNVGGLVGDRKTGDIAGRIAADVGANAITGGGYGLAKTAAQGLSSGGVGGLLSSKGLQEAALGAAGSYAGIDPNLIKTGLAAAGGDIKGAALSGLSSLGGFDPKQLQMASTGVSALTGDKKGLASGLASQFGASDSAANMLGSVAGGDIKGALLGKLAGATGLDQKMLENVSKGKFDPMQLAAAGGLDSSSLLGGAADKLGISSFTKSPEAQEMINMGKSAGRSLASVEKNIQEAKSTAEDTYKIAKGDSFNAIAKKMGVTPEQLKAANPQIKDINKIASGANLNIPKAASQAVEGARQNVTDKYLKDAQGRTIYGANNAPIANPNFSAEEYDKAQAQRADLAEDAAAYVPGQQLGEEKWTMDRVLGNIKREGGKALDTIKTGAGAVGGAIGGALSSAKDFAAENKGALGLAADAAAAYGGYRAGQEASEKVEDLSKQQLRDLQAQGKAFEGITYDPERYKQQRQFLQESISGGGRSALTRQLAAESDREAGAAEAAARGAALQKAAEIGGGAGLGLGSMLQSSFSGAATGAGIRGKAGLERATTAERQYREDLEKMGKLSTQQTSEEADLARQQGIFGLDKTRAVGGVRGELGNIEMGRGAALQNLYSSGADMAKQALSLTQSQQEKANADANAKYQADMREAQLAKARNEAGMNQPTTQTPPPPAPEKTAAAQKLSQGTQTVQTTTPATQPKNVTDKFNQTYSGPMARPQPNAQPQNPMQQMTSQLGQFAQGAMANPQQAAQTVQNKVEEVKKDPLKAATGLFNQWTGK